MPKTACFIFLIIFSGCKSLVPQKYRVYFSEIPWQHISLAADSSMPSLSDSMVVFRTNRAFHPGKQQFLDDIVDPSGTLRTFVVIVKSGKWLVIPVKDIDTGMKLTGRKQNLVVYAEGMGKNFYLAGERALGMSAQYKVSVIMMDYPSINPVYGMAKNFRFARRNSFNTAPDMIGLLRELDQAKKSGLEWTKVNWTLFHHSMGNIMLRRMLMEQAETVISPYLFDLVVLNAACTEEKKHSLWLERSKLGKHFIVNYNKDDRQLKGAQLLTLKRQLGTKPRKPLAQNASYIDFNPLVGPRHSTFANIPLRPPIHPHARQYYTFILNGRYPDFKNQDLFLPAANEVGYYLK